ncbi:MAG: hypothetical protein IKC73_01630, partial [Clostridia bacterium]|nr:hypothetical protein [Clostridia bacterium]
LPGIRTVITKYGKTRNTADFVDEDALYEAFYRETVEAVKAPAPMRHMPLPTEMEIRYTRMEIAEERFSKFLKNGLAATMDEADCHIIRIVISTMQEFDTALYYIG